VNSRVFGVCELKYAIRIFNEANSIAMTTKFRQKIFSSVQGRRHFFCTYDRVFGISEFQYVIRNF